MMSLAAAALAAGLLGGVHCAGMCGGIVASLAVGSRGAPLARQAAFNAGRIATYACAGAIAGFAGGLAQLAGPALVVQAILFAAANVLIILLGLYVAGWGRVVLRLERLGSRAWRAIEPFARRLFPVDSTAKALAAGALWGWVPCGLVYTMLSLSLASGSAAGGAFVMAAFGAGTLPTLLGAGLAAQRVMAARRVPSIRYGAAMIIIAMGAVGLARVPGLPDAVAAGWACIGETQ
jgi:sulfite exporter TauE/SafE